jgi:hypothetical protein
MDLFAVPKDGRVHTSSWTVGGDWSGIADNWTPIGGFFPAAAAVTPVCRTPDTIDLFILGADGRVYTSWWSTGHAWSGAGDNWRPIGGFFPAGATVAAVSRAPDSLDLFIVGTDRQVYANWWPASR